MPLHATMHLQYMKQTNAFDNVVTVFCVRVVLLGREPRDAVLLRWICLVVVLHYSLALENEINVSVEASQPHHKLCLGLAPEWCVF